jgi:hypothetical protein
VEPSAWVEGQARLLGSGELRTRFAENPQAVAAELGEPRLASLDPAELERQAATLVAKRRHEAAKLLPRTFEALGRDAAPIFEEFAAGFWPEGATRHAQDASAFCGWLAARKDLRLDPEERLRLRFALGKQHVLLGLVRRLKTDRGCRFGLLAVVRRQGRVHVLRIYLALPGRATDLVPLR